MFGGFAASGTLGTGNNSLFGGANGTNNLFGQVDLKKSQTTAPTSSGISLFGGNLMSGGLGGTTNLFGQQKSTGLAPIKEEEQDKSSETPSLFGGKQNTFVSQNTYQSTASFGMPDLSKGLSLITQPTVTGGLLSGGLQKSVTATSSIGNSVFGVPAITNPTLSKMDLNKSQTSTSLGQTPSFGGDKAFTSG